MGGSTVLVVWGTAMTEHLSLFVISNRLEDMMSYSRFGQGSDVYVYLDIDGYFCCCACRFRPDIHSEHFKTTEAMLAHLDQHVAAGHAVPESCFGRLREEATENDEWIADYA